MKMPSGSKIKINNQILAQNYQNYCLVKLQKYIIVKLN